ncbi:MAG: rhomboid family intramembrane serine protease [Verrucomicrobiota bacterium]|nr:rhomboid family intramembrane serine protease [Verrucomicrobiota bacterium]
MTETPEQPVWASPDNYPVKPETSPYGALSSKGRVREFESLAALAEHVRNSRESVEAVWRPQDRKMMPPEASVELMEPLRKRFADQAEEDGVDARRNTLVFSFLLLWALYANLANRTMPTESVEVGLAGILLVILGFVPWYEAWRNRRSAMALDEQMLAGEEQEARFERWLRGERSWCMWVLVALLAVGGAVQVWVGLDVSVAAAGLDKERYRGGEFYRLLTAPFLHGHPLHWALNAAGLWYLGRRVEVLAGWPHLALVFLISILAGGVATAQFMPNQSSVGASGGLLGLLGFLIVFETLHSRLVPRPSRRRLGAALIITFVIGFFGYRFIDNWAHGGGLVAGMFYGLIVFPKSRSARRPRANRMDRFFGGVGLLVLAVSLGLGVIFMLTL